MSVEEVRFFFFSAGQVLKRNLSFEVTEMEESKIIRRLSLVGIVGNIILVVFKMFAGIVGNSGAMVSDAVHSLSDVFATLIAALGVRISRRKPDEMHPYGHDRFESLASLVLGVILFVTGLGIGCKGVMAIIAGNYDASKGPAVIALVAAVVSIVTKEAMYHYTMHYAKKLNSSAFKADAWHHRSDAFSSVGSLIGIGGAMLGYPVMDSIAAVVISVFILKVGFDILKEALSNMMDTSCGPEYDESLKLFILQIPGVESVDMVLTRKLGNKIYIDAEISVDGQLSLEKAHDIAEDVHYAVEKRSDDIKHIMIHVNPARKQKESGEK